MPLQLASCDWIVGICEATVNNLKSMHTVPARRIVRVYNGATPLKRAAKQDWPPKSGFTLVYVGRLEPVKNHALLLNAFRGALASMPDLRLWMVGDGSERGTLERLAAELGIVESGDLLGATTRRGGLLLRGRCLHHVVEFGGVARLAP